MTWKKVVLENQFNAEQRGNNYEKHKKDEKRRMIRKMPN